MSCIGGGVGAVFTTTGLGLVLKDWNSTVGASMILQRLLCPLSQILSWDLFLYLGVPLITVALPVKKCEALTDCITSRIRGWADELVFSRGSPVDKFGKFQHDNFWCAHFLRLKKVLKMVQQRCMPFLRNETDNGGQGVKVKWNQICKPRAEGGLGICDTDHQNKIGIF